MKLIFDARVLTHQNYTGVENYTNNILSSLKEKLDIKLTKPKTRNKYLAHLWTHMILPFKRTDILFCPANIAPIFVPQNKKLILTVHDIAFEAYPSSFSFLFRLYYKFMIKINIKRADEIITVSKSSKNEIEKYYPKSQGKIKVIQLGLDEIFKPLGLMKKKQILYVGSMNERKNFIGILKAFDSLNISEIKLIMLGNYSSNFSLTDEAHRVLSKAEIDVNIEFKSGIDNDELVKLYNESQVFIFPSFYEGFGLPVLEAMACGTPVICSNSSSLPEVAGDAAIYCNPYNTEDIKEKIKLVLNDEKLQEEMITKGLDQANKFSWDRAATEHIKIFNKALES